MNRLISSLTSLLVLIALSAFAVACGDDDSGNGSGSNGSGSDAGSGKLTLNTWGGAYQEAQEQAIVAPFEEETGIDVTVTNPIDYAKLKAMVDSDQVVWDVADVEPYVSRRGCKEGWLEKLDYEVIDRSRFLESMPTTECSVPNGAFGLGAAYNTEEFGDNPPAGWADFFDVDKFPGKRAIPKYAESGILEAALLADGVAKEDLYPIDYERAFKKLDTIKDELVFWESGDQSEQLMQTGEVRLCACWATRMYDAKTNLDAPVAMQFNEMVYGWDDFVVPKGAKNLENAMKFIEFGTATEQEIGMTKFTPWGPSDQEAADNPDPATADWVPTSPEHRKVGVPIDYEWWAENYPRLDELFAQWLL